MTIELKPLMTIHFDLGTPLDLGVGPFGKRVIYEVTGGSFTGEKLRGTVLPGGGDWVLFDAEGVARLDVRVLLETHDDAKIYMHYPGILVPNEKFNRMAQDGGTIDYGDTYIMTQPQFETGDGRYRWLNRLLAVAEGRCSRTWVEYRVYELGVV